MPWPATKNPGDIVAVTDYNALVNSVRAWPDTCNANGQDLVNVGTIFAASIDFGGGIDLAAVIAIVNAATAANTPSTLVERDVSGNFAAGTITAALDGNAATVTDGLYSIGSYSDPAWLTSLAGAKISGNIAGQAGSVANGVYTNGSYTDPAWLTLTKAKVGLGNVENTALSTWAGTANITAIGTLASGSVPWARLTSVPSTFAPSAHTHAATDLTGAIVVTSGRVLVGAGASDNGSDALQVNGGLLSGGNTAPQYVSTAANCFEMRNGATSKRWRFNWANTESGSNAGSDLVIYSYNDSGVFLGAPLTLTRSTGDAAFSRDVTAGRNVVAAAANWHMWTGRAALGSPADSVITLYNAAGTDFSRLQFGGTSASFPALKRNAAALDVRLADDSAYAALNSGAHVANGHLTFGTDNSYDIGASGATRPRTVYVGTSVVGGQLIAGASSLINWAGRSTMSSGSDGVIVVMNAAGTDFGRFQFGGTSASFPALKRVSDELDVRLADDSAQAGIRSSRFRTNNMSSGISAQLLNDATNAYLQAYNYSGPAFAPLMIRGSVIGLLSQTGDPIIMTFPNSAPSDSLLGNGQFMVWYDEGNNRVAVRVKSSAGVLKTGYITVS